MPILRVGRVGTDTVDLNHPSEATITNRFESGRELMLRGFLTSTTVANARYLRTEILAQQGRLVALVYTGDDLFDGYYVLAESRVDIDPGTYRYGGFPYEIALIRIGSDSRTQLQSLLTGNTVTNAHSVTPSPWIAFPPNTLAVDVGGYNPTEAVRTGASGAMNLLVGLDRNADPTWSVTPGSYYGGSAKLYTQGLLRAGLDLPKNDPTDWIVENDFVRIRPAVYQGTSNGELEFYFHSGSAWSTTPVNFHIDWDGSTKVPRWHFMTPLWNEPEEVRIRLVRDAETSPPGAHSHQLDINVRRGAPYASFYYKYSGNDLLHEVSRSAADPATTATGYITDSGTIDGHKWILGSPQAQTQDLTNGRIRATVASPFLKFFIGAALNNATTGQNAPASVMAQYHGWVAETVRAVRR